MASPFALRGIVEGFYGRVWTWAQRQSVMEFAAAHDMNLYLYAPKMDPRHRLDWREPYGASQMRRFSDLIALGRQHSMEFGWAIAPGLDLDYTSAEDMNALRRKLDAFWDIGCRAFAILWDDIPHRCDDKTLEAFGSLAKAQARTVNQADDWLQQRGESTIMMTCPTKYCGDPDCEELREFGLELEDGIQVLWTGPEVCSRELTSNDAQNAGRILHRDPLYWDNYPVNDMLMSGEMHLEPLSGRTPGLGAHAVGLLSNPMTQPEASKIALATVAAYLNDPLRYEPEAAWMAAAEEVAGPNDAPFLAALRRGLSGNCLNARPWQRTYDGLSEVAMAWRMGRPADLTPLAAELRALSEAGRHVEAGLQNKALGRELKPWARRVRVWADAMMSALIPLDRRAAGGALSKTHVSELASALRGAATALKAGEARTFGDELWDALGCELVQTAFPERSVRGAP